MTSRGCI